MTQKNQSTPSGLEDKAESIAEKMNRITAKLAENIDLADELVLTGDDVIDSVREHTQSVPLYTDNGLATEVISLNTMVEDFKFVRETLRENAENGRRVLNRVTLDLLDSEDEKRASLIMSFAELNRAVADNMKLYMQSYKDISSTLLNIDKIRKANPDEAKNANSSHQHVHFHGETKSTAELIKSLGGKK